MLTELLMKIFVPGCERPEHPKVRLRCGMFCGWVGIAVNVFLSALKFAVGIASGSVAVAADAVNNLSDAGGAAVTLLGFKLSAKPADSGHPFGHGRIEQIAGVIVAVVVIAMGLNFFKESVSRIVHPGKVEMSAVMISLVVAAMLFKAWLFFFYRRVGTLIGSETIRAAAFDSLCDLGSTTAVLIAVTAGRFTNFPVDGCAGAAVALLVLLGGIKILRETSDPLLGKPPSPELVEELRARLLRCEGIRGVHDVIMHNYGPNRYFATAHAEVAPGSDILTVHDLLEKAEAEIGQHMPVHLLLHCDPCDADNPELRLWQGRLENAVAEYNPRCKVYDLRLRHEDGGGLLEFHLLLPRDDRSTGAELETLFAEALDRYPDPPRLKLQIVRSYV
ncbi:MAG: cation transporter [Lentisphaeria bacterium]|nr:cation transporter [Lentisphaeria bacterium]